MVMKIEPINDKHMTESVLLVCSLTVRGSELFSPTAVSYAASTSTSCSWKHQSLDGVEVSCRSSPGQIKAIKLLMANHTSAW